MRIRGILFDLYGTLLVYGDMQKAWSDWLETFYHLLKKRGLNIPIETFSKQCDGFFSTEAPIARQDHLTALERRILALAGRLDHNLDKEALRHIADRIAAAWQTHIFIDPETIPVLTALKQNKMLGLVSNFDHPPHVRSILSRYGIENLFDTIVISSEVGIKKPEPAIFTLALEQTGLLREEAVYVGDTETDVAGATAAGIHPIFIARPGSRTEGDALDFQAAYRGADLPAKQFSKNKVTIISNLQEVLQIATR